MSLERQSLTANVSELLLGDNAANTEGAEQVLGSIGVIVDTSIESLGGVLANEGLDEGFTSGMGGDELGNVVHQIVDNDKGRAFEASALDVVLGKERELLNGKSPVESAHLVFKSLLRHLQATLLDFVIGEALKIEGETQNGHNPDGPLGRIVSVPVNAVAEIVGELVVEVVVSLTKGQEGDPGGVTRRMNIREGQITNVVSQRVDAEGRLKNEDGTQDGSVEEATTPVSPTKTRNEDGQGDRQGGREEMVVLLLPSEQGVRLEIGAIGFSDRSLVLLNEQPSHVGPEESAQGVVGVLIGIDIAVMSAVVASPPQAGALESRSSAQQNEEARGPVSGECAVRKHAMVSDSNSESGSDVANHGEDESGER